MKTPALIDRVPALDLLRFLAAFAVMLYHYTYHSGGGIASVAAVTMHGHLGVEVFFMISGFVILWSAKGRTPRGFLRARILRLYPEFWLALVIAAAAFTMVPGGFAPLAGAAQLAGNATMLPSYLGVPYLDGVYWTLAIEIKFYAIVWALILLRQIERIEWWLLGWLAASVVAELVDVGGAVRSLIIYPYGPFFAAGGLFFLCFDSGWSRARIAGLAVALALCANASLSTMGEFVKDVDLTVAAKVTTVAIILAAFVGFGFLRKLSAVRWPSWAVLVGSLTYPLYLVHNVGREVFINQDIGWPVEVRVVLAIAFSLALAWAVMWASRAWVLPLLKRILDAVALRDAKQKLVVAGSERKHGY